MLNYTTSISATVTVQEIQTLLAKAGASAVMVEYDGEQNVSAISFKVKFDGRDIGFRLPGDPVPTLAAIRQQKERYRRSGQRFRAPIDMEQAQRVTWRVIKDWIEAQLAMIEAHQAALAQVFLPYAVTNDGKTLYEQIAADPSMLLGPGHE
jgi:hypothetical protein